MTGLIDSKRVLSELGNLVEARSWPFAGVALVFRQQLRCRRRRDLLGVGVLLCLLLGLSGVLELGASGPLTSNAVQEVPAYFWQGSAFYLSSVQNYFLRWLIAFACGAALLLVPLAGILGARAVPDVAETAALQEALLTRLRPRDLCLGRLLAALWPVAGALGLSCLFWLSVLFLTSGRRLTFAPSGATVGVAEIGGAYLLLACAVVMVGGIGFLFASRTGPGALWGRGAAVALAVSLLCSTAIVAGDPFIRRLENPVPVIDILLQFNPIAGVASALKLDILRTHWLYQHTEAHDYAFHYPMLLPTSLLYLCIGALCLWIAAVAMQRAYR